VRLKRRRRLLSCGEPRKRPLARNDPSKDSADPLPEHVAVVRCVLIWDYFAMLRGGFTRTYHIRQESCISLTKVSGQRRSLQAPTSPVLPIHGHAEFLAYIIKPSVAIVRYVPIRDCLAMLLGTIQYHTLIGENIALLLQRLPSSRKLAATPKNGDDLGLPGKGPRSAGYPYISYLRVARFWNFS
jgi:hypothetical protein